MKEAMESNVNVVKEQFVEEVKNGGAALLIKSHRISSWGCDVSVCMMMKVLYGNTLFKLISGESCTVRVRCKY